MTVEPITLAPSAESVDKPIQVRLLGPLELAGGPVPHARKVRQTLALLAVRANTLVSTGDLIMELWDSVPPRKDVQSVQTYIMRLRQLEFLDIEFRQRGYILHVAATDSERFGRFVDDARRELRQGATLAAQDLLRAAFSLWRGDPLEDVHRGPLLANEAARITDCWRTALDLQWEIDLGAGRHREVVDGLAAAVRAAPMREDTAAKLMLALYRSNRRAEALQVFQRLRSELVREIGLEPCPALCRLQQQILAGDPVLELNGEH